MKRTHINQLRASCGFLNTEEYTERKQSCLRSPSGPPRAKVPQVSNRIENNCSHQRNLCRKVAVKLE